MYVDNITTISYVIFVYLSLVFDHFGNMQHVYLSEDEVRTFEYQFILIIIIVIIIIQLFLANNM